MRRPSPRWIGPLLALLVASVIVVPFAVTGASNKLAGSTDSATTNSSAPTTEAQGSDTPGLGTMWLGRRFLGRGQPSASKASPRTARRPPVTPPSPHAFVQLGVDVWWTYHGRGTPSAQQLEASNIVSYIRSDLHANSVAISFPIYISSLSSDDVFDGPKTPPPSEVAMFVGTAQNAGLRVELRPLLEVGTAGYIWRGLIHPSDATAFFDSYGQALAPYAELAQQLGVSGFVYASELYSLSRSPDYEPSWSQLISQLSSFYHGPLVYAESGAQYLSGADVVPDLTTYGEYTDAYFGAAGATPGSSGTELYNSWASQFDRLATQKSSNTVLQEVGFDAQAIGYEAPQTVAGPPTDSQYLYMQQMWFNMVCSIVHNFDLAGVYFWNIDFNVDPYTTPANDPTLGPTDWVNRPGAAAIASCFSSFGSAG